MLIYSNDGFIAGGLLLSLCRELLVYIIYFFNAVGDIILEPMMAYPGTMLPGTTPENMPYQDLQIRDDNREQEMLG